MSQGQDTYRGDVIGWGPWRARWYSICSMHGPGTPVEKRYECRLCLAGSYINDWSHAGDSFVYRHARRTWLWWHNRPNSKSRRRLARFFPGLP